MSDQRTTGFVCAVIGICALIVLGYCFCPYLNHERRRPIEQEWYTDDHWKPRCRGRRRPAHRQSVSFNEPSPTVEETTTAGEEGAPVEEEGELEAEAQQVEDSEEMAMEESGDAWSGQ